MKRVSLHIDSQEVTDIRIGSGVAEDLRAYLDQIASHEVWFVTEPPLAKLLCDYLDLRTENLIFLSPGESQKNMENVELILGILNEKNASRQTTLVSFGGGVVSDITGFAASIYKRGVNLVSVPTSLLSMIDASIGGKNGVNFGGYKNVIGTFYNPRAVFIDTDFIARLPKAEVESGLGELVKYAICQDKILFDLLQAPPERHLIEIVERGVRDKIELVEKDPHEQGSSRQLLNFGHTLGHALESVSEFRLKHGQAVAIGCYFAAFVSMRKGYVGPETLNKVQQLLNFHNLPLTYEFSVEEVMRRIGGDKKKTGSGDISFVLIKGIGQGFAEPLSLREIEGHLAEFQKVSAA